MFLHLQVKVMTLEQSVLGKSLWKHSLETYHYFTLEEVDQSYPMERSSLFDSSYIEKVFFCLLFFLIAQIEMYVCVMHMWFKIITKYSAKKPHVSEKYSTIQWIA